MGTDHYDVQEYSIFGWFKASPSLARQKANCEIMRLTNNPADFAENVIGFRTLQVYFKTVQYELATYDLQQPQPNMKKTIEVGHDFGTWTYFLMAYSMEKENVFAYVQFPHRSDGSYISYVRHMTPGYLAFHAGKEFNGYLAHVGVAVGVGAYQDKNKDNYPSLHKFDAQPDVEAGIEGYLAEEREVVVEEVDIQGATEYGWGVWTRWLTAYATSRKMPQHSLVRMTTNKDHKDHSQPGDRVLAAFVERGVYVFSTYDARNPLDRQSIPYEDDLEGNWNFVYFSYDNQVAMGYVYFSELDQSKSVYFKVQHYPVLDYVRVLAGVKEFIYDPFYGQLYDLRVRIGCGFIQKQEELKSWMLHQLEPEPTHFLKQHIDALEEEKQ